MYPCSTCVSKNPTAPVFFRRLEDPGSPNAKRWPPRNPWPCGCAPSNLVQGRMSKHSKQQVVKRIGIMQEFVPVSRKFQVLLLLFLWNTSVWHVLERVKLLWRLSSPSLNFSGFPKYFKDGETWLIMIYVYFSEYDSNILTYSLICWRYLLTKPMASMTWS